MKLLNNRELFIETADFITAGLKAENIWNITRCKSATLPFIKDPTNAKLNIYPYEKLGKRYKQAIQDHFGNPYEHVATEPIRQMVTHDQKAFDFFLAHELPNGKQLDHAVIAKYATAASWLNMIIHFETNQKQYKKQFGLDMSEFYMQVGKMIDTEKVDLPSSLRRLRESVNDYKARSYESLISEHFGNKAAAKVCDELSEALLLELISHRNQYDDALVSIIYNEWAAKNNYKEITAAAVGVWRKKTKVLTVGERNGMQVYNTDFRRKVSRSRPTQPTFLWESDDNHLDWWFQGDKANEYRKIKGIIVTDSFNDYVLGYALTEDSGDMPTDIVKLAYLNAMHHIKELTGGYYLPYQVVTDQWRIKQLEPFYKSFTKHYHKTPIGSKGRGYLENFFGSIDFKRGQKIGNDNYTGNNITATNRGVNIELTVKNKKMWPHISEAFKQMEQFIHRLRCNPRNYDKKNLSRQQEWLQAWQQMPEDQKTPISEEQMLLKFGLQHRWTNTITDQGIMPTIAGRTYNFAIPEKYYLENIGKTISVIYDPYDLSKVLVVGEGVRFLAPERLKVASCAADMQGEGSRKLLQEVLDTAKRESKKIGDAKQNRIEILEESGMDVETVIKLGGMVAKEVKQIAEQKYFLPYSENSEEETTQNTMPIVFEKAVFNPLVAIEAS